MTVAEVKTAFLENLLTKGYFPAEIERQEVVLRKTFLYGLALHHPDMPRRVKRLRADEFGTGGPVTYAACETFLQATCAALASVRYFNLASLYKEHPQLLPSRGRAVPSFLESLGATIDIRSVSRRLMTQLLASLDLSTSRARRAPTIIRAFLEFCFEQGWLGWNPQAAQRMPSERVFETDFFGPPQARWADHARAYLFFLQEDRNLAAGGIDYYARKLKPFVQWLDGAGTRTFDRSSLEAFLEHKRNEGISPNTVSKYLYCIRPFLDFLIRTPAYVRGRIRLPTFTFEASRPPAGKPSMKRS